MGGEVSREKLVGTTYERKAIPIGFFKAHENIYGCGLPVTNEHLQNMIELNINLLVTTTIEPLSQGPKKMTNYRYYDNSGPGCHPDCEEDNNPEWHTPDENLFENTENLKQLHIPISDGHGPPNMESVEIFLAAAEKMVNSGKSVCVHCWQGKGRTATLIACYLIRTYKYELNDVINLLKTKQNDCLKSYIQCDWLRKNYNKLAQTNNKTDQIFANDKVIL